MVEVSVVVPVYNSEGCVEELHRQIREALDGQDYEVILVNDQSTDGSWAAIRRVCAEDGRVTGVNLRKNAGQDNALLCGLRLARGAFVVVMDDDLQHSPSDIPALCAHCRTHGLDVCYARFAHKRHALWKNLGSWLNGKLAETVIGKPKALYLSPFKVMRQEIAKELIAYTGPFAYVDGLIFGVTNNVGQIDVQHRERFSGEGHYNLAKSVLVFLRLATGFSVWPLRFSSCVGLVCALCGFALAVFYLIQYAVLEHRVEGWITLVILTLVLGGIQLFAVGVLGEYLGRLYLSAGGRPQATVKEICGGGER